MMKKFTAVFTIVCICLTMMVSLCMPAVAAEANWYEGFTLSGAAKLNNGLISINPSSNEKCIELTWN